jgi:nitrite reductase/ring-hydroxylating ferredoxin subunit
MLTREENHLLTTTQAGTPMGDAMRRYWIPALLSRELPEPDGAPVQVQLLGERLVGFRDTAGRIGLVDEFCPHRRVSLWLGRNEEHGLRCVYHGWKFDVGGHCVDQMNEPEPFCQKIRLQAYPTVEMGGVIWAYMGPREKMPPAPAFEWARAAESHRHVSKVWEECNWLQALEGGIDTSHAPILHRAITTNTARPGIPFSGPFVRGGKPTLEVDFTDYGYRYVGVRPLGDDETYVRSYHFVMPFTQIRPQQIGRGRGGEARPLIAGHMWVPIDDENCMVWNWVYSFGDEPLTDEDRRERGNGNGPDYVDQQTFRSFSNKRNGWRIDRKVQKTETFSGIEGINTQDRAVQESMGPIVDRSQEHLGPADKAVIGARKLLLQAVRTVQDGGDPPGVGTSYYQARAIEKIFPRTSTWRETVLPEMYTDDRSLVPVGSD